MDSGYDLWWPAGYGAQPLYQFDITFTPADESAGGASSLQRTIGFRQLQLVRQPLRNATGQSFFFRVNDVAIYAKGEPVPPPRCLFFLTPKRRLSCMLHIA